MTTRAEQEDASPSDLRAIEKAKQEYRDGKTKSLDYVLGYADGKQEGARRERKALEDIRLVAARGLAFGHQSTPQTPERMIEKKDLALKMVLGFCAKAGIAGTPLRLASRKRKGGT